MTGVRPVSQVAADAADDNPVAITSARMQRRTGNKRGPQMSRETAVSVYRMNPAEDEIRFGDELMDDMWVLPEDPDDRLPYGDSEEEKIRAQRFRRVTRLRRMPGFAPLPDRVFFIGEWVDGYQQVHELTVTHGLIVKRDEPRDPGTEADG